MRLERVNRWERIASRGNRPSLPSDKPRLSGLAPCGVKRRFSATGSERQFQFSIFKWFYPARASPNQGSWLMHIEKSPEAHPDMVVLGVGGEIAAKQRGLL